MKKFNKTLAIALAAGLSIGGVTVPIGDAGNSFGFGVASASAAELDKSVVTKTELVSDKSGKNVLGTTVEATKEAYDNFFNTHGEDFKLKLEFKIPDSARPGDTFVVKNTGVGSFLVQGVIQAPTPEGRKVGSLNVGTKLATFTVSNEVENARDRTASFEVPFGAFLGYFHYSTSKQAQDGKPAPLSFIKFSSKPESSLELKKVYLYESSEQSMDTDMGDVPNSEDFFKKVDLDIGLAVRSSSLTIGYADMILQDRGADTSEGAHYDDVYKLDESAKTNRDVTVRYVIDDKAGRIIPTPEIQDMMSSEFSPTGFDDVNGTTPANKDSNTVKFYKHVDGKSYKVTYNQVNEQTLEVTVHDVPPHYKVRLHNFMRAESPYSPGKTVTLTSTFVNGVGKPHSAYDERYTETKTKTYTHPTFAGYGSASDIKRNVTMTAKVNGKDANTKATAEQVKGGKAKFSIDLKNNGNIGAGSATVKYPKGVTGPKGETEKFIDFGSKGFPAGSTKTLDLGELTVPKGTNENKFTVVMTGYPQLTDAAWTTIATTPTTTPKPTTTAPKPTTPKPTTTAPKPAQDIFVNKAEVSKPDSNGNVTVTLTYSDPKQPKTTFRIPVGKDGIQDVKVENGKLVVISADGTKKEFPLTKTTVTEDKAKKTVTIVDDNGNKVTFSTEDLHVTDVKKVGDNYEVTRSDGTKWTINLKDIRDKIAELEKNKADKTEVAKLKKELDALETTVTAEFKQVKGDITTLKTDITNLKTRVTNLEKRVGDLEKKQITKVVGDKGEYTLVREDGSVVEGVIDTSGDVVSIKDNGDGSVTITRVDGSTETVTLTHTKVVEDKAKHTVTITTPGGKPVVINTFDTFISDVKKQDNGDYLVTRNDGKSWTISTSELQKQIDDLGSKLAETNKDLADLKETAASKEEVAKLKEELDKHTKQLADHEQRLKELEANGATKDDIAALEKDIADNKAAIDGITEQITTIITRVETLEKGVADNAQGIEGLKKDLGDVANQVEKNTQNIGTNGKEIADLREKVVTNTQEIIDLKEKAATKEQLLEVVRQVENHEKRITDLENQGASKEELAKTQAELDELKDKLAEFENKAATKADVDKLAADIADHADKIAALEKETAELNSKLVELNRVVEERFEKVTERITALETRADETDKALVGLGNRVTELEVSIQNIKVDITKLGDRVSALEAKVTDLTKRVEGLEASDKRQNEVHDAWAKCYSGASVVGIAALLAAPLLVLASGAGNGSQMNTDIQKQLGIFNPEMAKWMAENQSVLNALGAVAGLAATIGLLSYAANQCYDYNNTKEVQKTPIGQLSSKVALRDKKPAEAK